MGGRVFRALRAGFCLHHRCRYRYQVPVSCLGGFQYGNGNYRYRYRSYFGLVVPKPFWFRIPTLVALPSTFILDLSFYGMSRLTLRVVRAPI